MPKSFIASTIIYLALMAGPLSVKASTEVMEKQTREHLKSAQTKMQRNEWRQAIEELKKSCESEPNDSNCWTLLGACYMQIGRFTEAKEAYENATKLSKKTDYVPDSPSESEVKKALQVGETDEQLRLSYLADMRKIIKRNWHTGSTIFTNDVVVAFKISKEGKPSCAKVKESSGNAAIDEAAVNAVKCTPTVGVLPAN